MVGHAVKVGLLHDAQLQEGAGAMQKGEQSELFRPNNSQFYIFLCEPYMATIVLIRVNNTNLLYLSEL